MGGVAQGVWCMMEFLKNENQIYHILSKKFKKMPNRKQNSLCDPRLTAHIYVALGKFSGHSPRWTIFSTDHFPGWQLFFGWKPNILALVKIVKRRIKSLFISMLVFKFKFLINNVSPFWPGHYWYFSCIGPHVIIETLWHRVLGEKSIVKNDPKCDNYFLSVMPAFCPDQFCYTYSISCMDYIGKC